MMNSNPETVSTDYDTSSRLYFEPLTVEDVLNVLDKERPEGIIVQFGGQTPLSLAGKLQEALQANPIPAASGEPAFSYLGFFSEFFGTYLLPLNICWLCGRRFWATHLRGVECAEEKMIKPASRCSTAW